MFLNIQIFNLIFNFRIFDLCYLNLEAGELFGILIMANFGIINLEDFFMKYISELQLYSFLLWF